VIAKEMKFWGEAQAAAGKPAAQHSSLHIHINHSSKQGKEGDKKKEKTKKKKNKRKKEESRGGGRAPGPTHFTTITTPSTASPLRRPPPDLRTAAAGTPGIVGPEPPSSSDHL
jgi:sRNA-binding protein